MQRIRFRDQDETNLYTVPINPSVADYGDSDDISTMTVIDGSPIRLEANFDSRIRQLSWDSFPNSSTTFTGLRSELKSYKGSLKQIHYGDIDHQSFGWKNIMIVNVSTVSPRGGELKTNLVVQFFFTESI